MLALLRDPVPLPRLAMLSLALALAVAVYCLAYTALAGRPETVAESLAWSLVNVLPWVPALEGAKRAASLGGVAAALAGGFAASVILGLGFAGTIEGAAFEAWRRVPALLLVAAIALGLRFGNRRRRANDNDELPLLPRQIDWVRAAGNYVELRWEGRTLLHRSTLAALADQLGAGFVRIHRGRLVRRDAIRSVETDKSGDFTVTLASGATLRDSRRYRSSLQH